MTSCYPHKENTLEGQEPVETPAPTGTAAATDHNEVAIKEAAILGMMKEAYSYNKQKQYDSAVEIYLEIIEQVPAYTEAYLALSKVYLACEGKKEAMHVLLNGVKQAENNDLLLDQWWEILLDVQDIENKKLTDKELAQISQLVYLTEFSGCFYSATELSGTRLANSFYIYFSYLIKNVDKETWLWFQNDNLRYKKNEYGYDERAVLSTDQANSFINGIYGIDNFEDYPLDDPETSYLGDDVKLLDGDYYCLVEADYEYAYLPVDSYRYLGDDLFYVVLNGDFTELPGSEDRDILIVDDYTHVLVEKTGTKFGFTVLSKLKVEDELLRENIILPSDMEKVKES